MDPERSGDPIKCADPVIASKQKFNSRRRSRAKFTVSKNEKLGFVMAKYREEYTEESRRAKENRERDVRYSSFNNVLTYRVFEPEEKPGRLKAERGSCNRERAIAIGTSPDSREKTT